MKLAQSRRALESSLKNLPPPKHGMKGTRIYRIWAGMKNRCLNPNGHAKERYLHKGITVCSEWLEFIPFMEWSMKNGYADHLTIDRRDGTKGYNPENCRWVSMLVQQNNRTNNHCLTFQGITATLSQWARITGIEKSTLRYRKTKLGWPVKKVLTQPVRGMKS